MPKMTNISTVDGKREKSIFRNWTPGDSKLLVITIAATVTANIVTVILVALAVIVARSFRPNPGTPGNYAFLFGISALPVITACVAFSTLRRLRRERATFLGDRAFKWVMAILGITAGFSALLYILGWIGLAAGIR